MEPLCLFGNFVKSGNPINEETLLMVRALTGESFFIYGCYPNYQDVFASTRTKSNGKSSVNIFLDKIFYKKSSLSGEKIIFGNLIRQSYELFSVCLAYPP